MAGTNCHAIDWCSVFSNRQCLKNALTMPKVVLTSFYETLDFISKTPRVSLFVKKTIIVDKKYHKMHCGKRCKRRRETHIIPEFFKNNRGHFCWGLNQGVEQVE